MVGTVFDVAERQVVPYRRPSNFAYMTMPWPSAGAFIMIKVITSKEMISC